MSESRSMKSAESIWKRALEIEEYYTQFPDWYWKTGLHDAKIVCVCEKEFTPNYKDKKPKRNCLEIHLDSQAAMFEYEIKKICLYNYKIKTPDFNVKKLENTWWMDDSLEEQKNGYYLSKIEAETAEQEKIYFSVSYEFAETERKNW